MSAQLPDSLRHLERFSKPAAERALSERLVLWWDEQMQDWDLVNADADLLPSLLPVLQEKSLSDDERFSLMQLAVASMDEAIDENQASPRQWVQLEALLREHASLHAATIWYWAEPSLTGEEGFAISDRMAMLWRSLDLR